MELTVDNLYAFLKSTRIEEENLESLNSELFNRIIKSLLNEFFPSWKIINLTRKNDYTKGGRCYIDSRCKEKVFNDITILNFNSLYPSIIIKLSEEGNNEIIDHSETDPFGEESWNDIVDGLVWNVPEFFKLYKFIFESRKELKSFNDPFIDKLVKILINYTYGSLSGRYSTFYAIGAEKIPALGRDIMDIFINGYPNNAIYADTDQVFFLNFDEIKEKVEKNLEEIGFDHSFKKINTLVLIDKKRYVQSEDYNLKTTGFKKILKLRDRQAPPPRKYYSIDDWSSKSYTSEYTSDNIDTRVRVNDNPISSGTWLYDWD